MGSDESKIPGAVDANEYNGDITFEKCKPKEASSYLDETLSDFKIIVMHTSGVWRFPCHRFVLRSINSRIASLCEKPDSKEAIITDVEPQIMEIILRYIYEKEILLNDWKMACEVLETAVCYQVQALAQDCEKFLSKSLTLRNVCHILLISDALCLTELKVECIKLCKNAAFIVLQTKAFMLLPKHLVMEILHKDDDVNVRGEMFVFQSLWNWSKLQCISKNLQLYETNIGTEFSNVSDCVRFECIGERQREFLPQFIKSKYIKDNQQTTNKVSNRYVKFPLNLHYNFFYSLIFDTKEEVKANVDPVNGSFISCIKFWVKLDAYIISLNTLCLTNSCSDTVKELKLSSAGGIVFSWTKDNEMFVKKGKSGNHVFSISDSNVVLETGFHAVRPVPLYKDFVYTLEITPYKSELACPRVVPVTGRRKSDLEITLCASLCCGLKSMNFVQAK